MNISESTYKLVSNKIELGLWHVLHPVIEKYVDISLITAVHNLTHGIVHEAVSFRFPMHGIIRSHLTEDHETEDQ